VLVAIVLVRILLHADKLGEPGALGEAARALGLVAAAGAVGALVPVVCWKPLRRLGYVGDLLTGVVAVMSYVLACSFAFGKPPQDGRDWAIMSGVATAIGLVLGHSLFRQLSLDAAASASEAAN
jgi:hypothetical protein